MATIVGDSLAYKPPASHCSRPSPVSSTGQTMPIPCDTSSPTDTSLMYEISFKRKKTELSLTPNVSVACALPHSSSLNTSSHSDENTSMDLDDTENNETKLSCNREDQSEVLDLTVTVGTSNANEKDSPSNSCLTSHSLEHQSPIGTSSSSSSLQTVTCANALEGYPLFSNSLVPLNPVTAIASCPLQTSTQISIPATRDITSAASPSVGLLQQSVMHPLGMFGPNAFGGYVMEVVYLFDRIEVDEKLEHKRLGFQSEYSLILIPSSEKSILD
ncbi:unnamed protein product [Echinostoma caproni]|uniref:EYA1 n=1 Tax=Echinostoma caproni TaxID=27848 RepID=A0A183AQM6_9TREM|nr:unnamed protein product [Echinostoma caproni]